MSNQISFSDIEYANRKRKTKRDEFLEIMEEVIPWGQMVEIMMPYYPSGERGRPPRGAEKMLRMYLLQNWFNLSDEGVEDAIYDSYAFRKFMGISFCGNDQAPDATTLCKFRKLLDENGITKMFFDSMKEFLDKHGKLMHGGTIVDATLIDAPTSTKNQEKSRDPDMHQTQKGGQWYFGEKFFVGVDAGTGYIHTTEVTPGNTAEVTVAHKMIREDDEVFYGDAAYAGIEKREEIKRDSLLSSIDYRVNLQKPYRKNKWISGAGTYWYRYIEWQKSRVRSKVEYAFFIIKRIFHYKKVRYRGLHKNRTQAYMLCTCANLFMLAQSGGLGVSS